jgi:uncharacterized lipoprotein
MGKMKYNVGQKIYYRGDVANRPGWFKITEAIHDKYFKGYELKEIDGERLLRVPEYMISEIDKGNGSTRFVTEVAYKAYKEQQLQQLYKALQG